MARIKFWIMTISLAGMLLCGLIIWIGITPASWNYNIAQAGLILGIAGLYLLGESYCLKELNNG